MKEPNYELIKKMIPPFVFIFFIISFVFLVLAFGYNNYFIGPFQFMLSVTIAFISLYFGVHSVILSKQANILGHESKKIANDSDEKMKAISELNFVEINAMIYGYIDDLEGLKGGYFQAYPSSTPDNKTVSNIILKKMIRNIDSALKVFNYISDETRNKFLCAFLGFSKAIKDHIIAFKDEDIKDYLGIIGLVEKYQFEDKEKTIDNLKKTLEEKLSNKI